MPPEHRIEHRQRGDQVGDVEVLHHRLGGLQVHERGVAHVHARGLGRAVGADEDAVLAARALDRVVDLARRHPEALGDELEVVDQRLHRGRQLVPRRQDVLAVVGDVVALGQAVEALLDDLHRLLDLGQADDEAVVVVAHRADRDLEVEVVVARVRLGLAQVPRVAGRAQQRAGDAEAEQRLLVARWRRRAAAGARSRSCPAGRGTGRRGRASRRRTRAPWRRSRPGCPPSRRRPGCSACACAGPTTSRTGRGSSRGRGSSTRTSRSRRGRARWCPATPCGT